MATYLIGDIQGCIDPLQRLLDAVRFDPAEDYLWPCGDLVNRGGHSLEVLRLLHSVKSQVSVTLGNHDLHLLAEYGRRKGRKSKNREFNEIFRADDGKQLIKWVRQFPLAAWSEEHQLLRVHAGIIPEWDVKTTLAYSAEVEAVLQSSRRNKFLRRMYSNRSTKWKENSSGIRRLRFISSVLTRIRFCNAKGRCNFKSNGPPSSRKKGYKPWFKHKHRQTRDVRVAFGHWAAMGLKIKPRYLALDSGCVWGGSLTAYRLEDEQLFQVPARR